VYSIESETVGLLYMMIRKTYEVKRSWPCLRSIPWLRFKRYTSRTGNQCYLCVVCRRNFDGVILINFSLEALKNIILQTTLSVNFWNILNTPLSWINFWGLLQFHFTVHNYWRIDRCPESQSRKIWSKLYEQQRTSQLKQQHFLLLCMKCLLWIWASTMT
jgi:hypothetical protein